MSGSSGTSGSSGWTTVPIGLLQGLVVSRKDNDEVYVSGGSVEVGGVVYNSDEQLIGSGGSLAEVYGETNLSHTASWNVPATIHDGLTDIVCTIWSGGGDIVAEIIANMGEVISFGKTRIRQGNGWTGIRVSYSINGAEYTTLDTQNCVTNEWLDIVGNVSAQYIKYAATSANLYIQEIEIFNLIGGGTTHFVYIDPPGSGTELAAENLILSSTEPVFDDDKGGYYHPVNTDQRAIAYFTTDESGYVPTSGFHMYLSGALDGTPGTSGSSGVSGTSGSSGASGTSGSSGVDGTSGSSGDSGTSGSSGDSGTSGTSGSSGADGTSGSSGEAGTSGTSGSSGISGGGDILGIQVFS